MDPEARKVRERFVSHQRRGSNKVVILSVEGVILDGKKFVKRQIDRAMKDDQVKAVVLRVDSPGGTITGSDYIYHHLSQLAKKKEIPITDLTKEPFIFREAGSGTRQIIEKFLARHGITPHDMKISVVLGSTEAIKDAVESGLGISIISRWAARKESKYGTLRLLSLREEKMVRDFSLVINKNTVSSNALDEFLTFLNAYAFDKLLT